MNQPRSLNRCIEAKLTGFEETHKPVESLSGTDLLVEIRAVGINPVDSKLRHRLSSQDPPQVLGFDASGVVVAVGSDAGSFAPGDEVYYAGDITRAGCNSDLHQVDSRLVALKPANLHFTEAAALPLTTLTAWEAIFDRLRVGADRSSQGERILIVNGAGGVGSMAIQISRHIAGLEVIATASREESARWCRQMGASQVINHHQLREDLAGLGIESVDYILCLHDLEPYWTDLCDLIRPQGLICGVVENRNPLPIDQLKSKSAGFVWEFMFTRALYQTDDLMRQSEILQLAARHFEDGTLQCTLTETLSPMGTETLARAHSIIEDGTMIGKLVIDNHAGKDQR